MNKRDLVALFKTSFKDWLADNAILRAAALTFFIILPLPSLLLIIVAFFAPFYGQTQATQIVIQQITGLAGPSVAALFRTLLLNAPSPFESVWTAITIVVFSLAGAIGAFAVLRDTMDEIWEVKLLKPRNFATRVKERIGPFVLVSALGLISYCLDFNSNRSFWRLKDIFNKWNVNPDFNHNSADIVIIRFINTAFRHNLQNDSQSESSHCGHNFAGGRDRRRIYRHELHSWLLCASLHSDHNSRGSWFTVNYFAVDFYFKPNYSFRGRNFKGLCIHFWATSTSAFASSNRKHCKVFFDVNRRKRKKQRKRRFRKSKKRRLKKQN